MIRRTLWVLAVGMLISPPLDPLLDHSMAGQMALQMPFLAALGVLARGCWPALQLRTDGQAAAAIVFAAGSLVFWMLPRSLDATVHVWWADQLMHANWVAVGWLLAMGSGRLRFHVRFAAGIYAAAMILAAGVVYTSAVIPVCSNYSTRQQNLAGSLLIWIGAVLFVAVLARAVLCFNRIASAGERQYEPLPIP
jgi:hypothetical protein